MIKVLTENVAEDIKHIAFIFKGFISFSANGMQYRVESSDIAKSENSDVFITYAKSLNIAIRNFKIRAFKYRGLTRDYGAITASFTGYITIDYCYGYEEVVQMLASGTQILTNQIEGFSYPLDTTQVDISEELATKYEVPRTLTREQATYIMLTDRHTKQILDRAKETPTEDLPN